MCPVKNDIYSVFRNDYIPYVRHRFYLGKLGYFYFIKKTQKIIYLNKYGYFITHCI